MPFQPKIASINKKKQQITEVKTFGSTFTVPAGVTKMLVTVIGGGGGGGGAYVNLKSNSAFATLQMRGSGASGAGGSSASRYFAAVPGVVCTYSIGGGGSGGVVSNPGVTANGMGGTGGNSTFTYPGQSGFAISGGGGGNSTQHRQNSSLGSVTITGVAGSASGSSSGSANIAPSWQLKGGNGLTGVRLVEISSASHTGNAAGSAAGTLNPGATPTGTASVDGGTLYGGKGAPGMTVSGVSSSGGAIANGFTPAGQIGGGGSGGAVNQRTIGTIEGTRSAAGGPGNPGAVIITYWKR